MNDFKTVIVIGNGFDLDAGLKTSYYDFARSRWWPFEKNATTGLAYYLNKERKNDWFDLETLLADYVKKGGVKQTYLFDEPDEDTICDRLSCINANQDCYFFKQLVLALNDYIYNENNKLVISQFAESCAGRFLKAISGLPCSVIYTFNYSNLEHFAMQIGVKDIEIKHVHGKVKEELWREILDEKENFESRGMTDKDIEKEFLQILNQASNKTDIILGIDDGIKLFDDGYNFLKKAYNHHYVSSQLMYDLLDAQNIIFFGHSLGQMDYHYFQEFFQRNSDLNKAKREHRKNIRFVTIPKSRHSILNQLGLINGGRVSPLFSMNDVKFVYTFDTNKKDANFEQKGFEDFLIEIDDWIKGYNTYIQSEDDIFN